MADILARPLTRAITRSFVRAFTDRSASSSFTPAGIFTLSEPGLWYQPSSFSTMFQNSTGATPVTVVEQPVGLILDKRLGLAPGSAADTSTGTATGSWLWSGGVITRNGSATGTASAPAPVVIGTTYLITFDVANLSGDTLFVHCGNTSTGQITANGSYTFRLAAASAGAQFAAAPWAGTAGQVTISNIVVRAIAGNHATQATSAARPVLSARVNFATYTEDMSNAVWAYLAPSSNATSDTVTFTGAGNDYRYQYVTLPRDVAIGDAVVMSVEIKAGNKAAIGLAIQDVGGVGNRITVTPTASWVRHTIAVTATFAVTGFRIGLDNRVSQSGDGIAGTVLVRNWQIEFGATPSAYQRVNTANDYDTGFPKYLRFDGVDDGLATATFTAGTFTANMDCFIAFRRNSTTQFASAFSGAKSFGVAESGSAVAATTSAGTPTYYINGVAVSGGAAATRAQLHDAVSTGPWMILEVRNLDLSTWTNFAQGNLASYLTNGAEAEIILAPAQSDDNRTKIREYLARVVGVTFPTAMEALYYNSAKGAWYTPSDFSTLFQDSAGTTPVTVVEQPIGKINDKSGRGNHATQATSAARPVLSARVNDLLSTDGYSGSIITPASGLVVVATGQSDPYGTFTARQIRNTTTTELHRLFSPLSVPGQRTYFVDVKNVDAGFVQLSIAGSPVSAFGANFNLAAGTVGTIVSNGAMPTATIVALSNGFYRCSVTPHSSMANISNVQLYVLEADAAVVNPTTTGTAKSVIVAGAQLGPIESAYQRVNTAADYNTVGFTRYSKLDGIDDFMTTTTGGGGAAGFFLCQAVNPVSRGTALATPVNAAFSTALTGGSLPTATYFYRVSAINDFGETLASTETSQAATVGNTNTITVNWGAVTGATGYKVYGRTSGGQLLIATVGAVTTYMDTGAVTPAGALPAANTTIHAIVWSDAGTNTGYSVATAGDGTVRFSAGNGSARTVVSSAAPLALGVTAIVTAWDDGTNLKVQINQGTTVSVARPVVTAGTAVITTGRANGAAAGYFGGNFYASVYRQTAPSLEQRTSTQGYVAIQSGVTL